MINDVENDVLYNARLVILAVDRFLISCLFSVCRQICRKALRGCLRVPGCKPVCYMCLRPVCHGVSDSEDDDDDSDKEDNRLFSDAHHSPRSLPEDIPLDERTTTETSAVVEYYNDSSVLLGPLPCQGNQPLLTFEEHRDYANVPAMSTMTNFSNMEYCNSPSHDYVNMAAGGECVVSSLETSVPATSSSHQYHNIDQIVITNEAGNQRFDLEALLDHNRQVLLQNERAAHPEGSVGEEMTDEKVHLGDKDAKGSDGSCLHYCSLEFVNKPDYHDVSVLDRRPSAPEAGPSIVCNFAGEAVCCDPETESRKLCQFVGEVQNGDHGAGLDQVCNTECGDTGLDKVCNTVGCQLDSEPSTGKVCHSVDEVLEGDSHVSLQLQSQTNADERTNESGCSADHVTSDCCSDDRKSNSVEYVCALMIGQNIDSLDPSVQQTFDTNTAMSAGRADHQTSMVSDVPKGSGLPNGHVNEDTSNSVVLDKSHTLIMLETDL